MVGGSTITYEELMKFYKGYLSRLSNAGINFPLKKEEKNPLEYANW